MNVIVWLSTLLEQYVPLGLGGAVISLLAMEKLILVQARSTHFLFSYVTHRWKELVKKLWYCRLQMLATLSAGKVRLQAPSAICDLPSPKPGWEIRFQMHCILPQRSFLLLSHIPSSRRREIFISHGSAGPCCRKRQRKMTKSLVNWKPVPDRLHQMTF